MAYRKVYFRIRTEGYASGWSSDADKAAFKEESRRLCDKDRHNKIGHQFVSELMNELLQKGWLVSTKTSQGEGIRTATDKERRVRQPVTQVDGQITMEGQPSPPEKAPKRKKPPAPSL